MKYSTFFSLLFFSISLTSCWSKEKESPIVSEFAQTTSASTGNNMFYLHDKVTRTQDAQKIFSDIIKSGNVIVDFYAEWCGPCKSMGQTINQVSKLYSSITFLKVDVDQYKELAAHIRSIPTLIFYQNGLQLARISGAQAKNKFIELIKQWYHL